MTAGEIALLFLGVAVALAGIAVIVTQTRKTRGLARFESDALNRSSLLNQDRIDRINASRSTKGGQFVDRLRIAFFGLWLTAGGALLVVQAFS